MLGIIAVFLLTLENIWVLTRKRRPSRRIIRKAMNALRELGLSTSKLVKTDQVLCIT